MSNRLALLGALSLILASTGCAMCSSPFDYDYNAYGGTWDRDERCRGRVGSAFEPAESRLVPIKPDDNSDADRDDRADYDRPAPTPTPEDMTPESDSPEKWSPKTTPREKLEVPPTDLPAPPEENPGERE